MKSISESQFLTALQADMIPGALLVLDEEESHHACKVFRHRLGDLLRVGNGFGLQGCARLLNADVRNAHLELLEFYTPAPPPRVHLALACLKDNDLEEVMESCGQLSIASMTLLRTAHSLEPRDSDLKRTLRRLELKSQVSWKQAHKSWLTRIDGPLPFATWLAQESRQVLLCDMDGAPQLPAELCSSNGPELVLAIGPEGGFSAAEQQAMRDRGAVVLSLGRTRLRAKTSPIVALGALLGMGVAF